MAAPLCTNCICHPQRYSEDIDLVQVTAGPFGAIIDSIRERLAFLGTPRINQKQYNNSLVYKIQSEEDMPMKLKIEVNTREHFSVYGLVQMLVKLESEWSKGEAFVPVYTLDELLATKLRALYQRKKGRDLFDLWYAITRANADAAKIVNAFKHYMLEEGHSISQREFIENMEKKISDKDFTGDMTGLLRSEIKFNMAEGYQFIKKNLLEKI